jgi:hypothetical protein
VEAWGDALANSEQVGASGHGRYKMFVLSSLYLLPLPICQLWNSETAIAGNFQQNDKIYTD